MNCALKHGPDRSLAGIDCAEGAERLEPEELGD
jgi:hypothetical protein